MPVFESAVIKLPKHDEESLTSEEKTAVESLLIRVNADPDELGTF